MESAMNLLVSAVLGYLLGSVPFAVIVSRAFRLADPRSFGSGNPGATNVLRSGSKAAALLTLLGDAAKGWLAMFVAAKVGAGDTAIAVAGLAAFLGHVFPFTLGIQGRQGRGHRARGAAGFLRCLAGITAASGWRWWCSRAIPRWGRWRRRRRRRSSAWWLLASGEITVTVTADVRSADLPPQEQHPQSAGRQRRPHRRPEIATGEKRII
jgi:hypothetical protein